MMEYGTPNYTHIRWHLASSFDEKSGSWIPREMTDAQSRAMKKAMRKVEKPSKG